MLDTPDQHLHDASIVANLARHGAGCVVASVRELLDQASGARHRLKRGDLNGEARSDGRERGDDRFGAGGNFTSPTSLAACTRA